MEAIQWSWMFPSLDFNSLYDLKIKNIKNLHEIPITSLDHMLTADDTLCHHVKLLSTFKCSFHDDFTASENYVQWLCLRLSGI